MHAGALTCTLRPPCYQLQGHTKYVSSVAWSPDGRQLASGSRDNSIRVWDATTGASVATLEVRCVHATYLHTEASQPQIEQGKQGTQRKLRKSAATADAANAARLLQWLHWLTAG
jgi:WD40 repeat protein